MLQNPVQIQPLAFSPSQASQRVGVSVRAIYALIAARELRSFKIGKRRLISDTELSRLVERKMREAA